MSVSSTRQCEPAFYVRWARATSVQAWDREVLSRMEGEAGMIRRAVLHELDGLKGICSQQGKSQQPFFEPSASAARDEQMRAMVSEARVGAQLALGITRQRFHSLRATEEVIEHRGPLSEGGAVPTTPFEEIGFVGREPCDLKDVALFDCNGRDSHPLYFTMYWGSIIDATSYKMQHMSSCDTILTAVGCWLEVVDRSQIRDGTLTG